MLQVRSHAEDGNDQREGHQCAAANATSNALDECMAVHARHVGAQVENELFGIHRMCGGESHPAGDEARHHTTAQ